MFKKRSSNKETSILSDTQFKEVLFFISCAAESEKNNKEDRLLFLQFMIDALKADVRSTYNLNFLMENIGELSNLKLSYYYNDFPKIIPTKYFKKGKVYDAHKETKVYVDLSTTTVWAYTRNAKSIIDCLRFLKHNKLDLPESSYTAHYYDYIDIFTDMTNYTHSCAVANYYKKGIVEAQLIKTTELFPFISTDGIRWYCTENDQTISKVEDFRIALIYEIAKLKYKYEKEMRSSDNGNDKS